MNNIPKNPNENILVVLPVLGVGSRTKISVISNPKFIVKITHINYPILKFPTKNDNNTNIYFSICKLKKIKNSKLEFSSTV